MDMRNQRRREKKIDKDVCFGGGGALSFFKTADSSLVCDALCHSNNARWRYVNNVADGRIKLPIKEFQSMLDRVNYSPQALIRTGRESARQKLAKVWRARQRGCRWG